LGRAEEDIKKLSKKTTPKAYLVRKGWLFAKQKDDKNQDKNQNKKKKKQTQKTT